MDMSQILEEIINETYAESITWENENPQHWQTIIYNYNFAYNAYSCDYKNFKLLFVEKKFPDHSGGDWDGVAESYFPEIIIIKDNKIIGTFNEHNISKDDLIRLAGAIESKNNGMKDFIKLFS